MTKSLVGKSGRSEELQTLDLTKMRPLTQSEKI